LEVVLPWLLGLLGQPSRSFYFKRGRQSKRLNTMKAGSKAKILRWQQYIEECRKEASFLSPEGKREMQTVIASYERLIAIEQSQAEHD
jgi:hypothetical protein